MSWASSDNSRKTMRANRGKDTRPELAVRRILHARGFRYRVHFKVPGMPRRTIDIAFPRQRLAVFIDGCFWHGCPDHYAKPKANAGFWSEKNASNIRRDLEVSHHLRQEGWGVLRFWEHHEPVVIADAISHEHQTITRSNSQQSLVNESQHPAAPRGPGI
ncbi:very short patch repair endonuclease [Propioniferax innocua]|nr:very short patch repair endonuclease [Propioniferax innocua]